jgi:hypothetical protein
MQIKVGDRFVINRVIYDVPPYFYYTILEVKKRTIKILNEYEDVVMSYLPQEIYTYIQEGTLKKVLSITTIRKPKRMEQV